MACALRDQLSLDVLYLADLDAIGGRPPRVDLYRQLADLGLDLWIDSGLRDARSSRTLADLGSPGLSAVVGLESLTGPFELAGIVDRLGSGHTIFSLDLFDGRPRMAPASDWMTNDPAAIAGLAIREGVRRLIILDLARVGTGRGTGTREVLDDIRRTHPRVEIIVGGGISSVEEILEARKVGATAVLVGSAIHDGRIGPEELKTIYLSPG